MTKTVYQAINAVQAALAKTGISKDRTTSQGAGYKFRGIDDVYKAVAPLLAEHGLCILPRMISRSCEDRLSSKGGTLFYVTVEAEFDVVSAADGSAHTIRTFGEAMDSGDKATNKAMSAAYKYAAFQMFAIPTEGDNDADAQTHSVAAKPSFKSTPTMGVMATLPPDRQAVLNDCADAMRERYAADDVIGAFEIYINITDAEEKVALWGALGPDSKLRAAVKKHGESLKPQLKAA